MEFKSSSNVRDTGLFYLINQVFEQGTLAFSISRIFSTIFSQISRESILISKVRENPANH